jgi:hypothetical protein
MLERVKTRSDLKKVKLLEKNFEEM